jgi:HEAT repeat protein
MKLPVVWLLVVSAVALASAQSPPAQSTNQDTATVLGRGWTALGSREPAQALTFAQQLLQANPASHDALALGVAATTTAGQPVQALDLYEAWLAASRHEDVLQLQPIAIGVLRQLAENREPRVKYSALAALAEAGDADAHRRLQELAGDQGAPAGVDADLALAGDGAAVQRLEAQVQAGGPRDKSAAIDALARADAKSATPALIAALSDPAPPSRMAAANALAELEAVEAIPALKGALKDPDPAVRNMAGVALARLGDESGGVTLESLVESPIGELRLQGLRAAARRDPQGTWSGGVERLLQDPDPLVRLRAAGLLLEFRRESETLSKALGTALTDETPAVRTEAARLLREVTQQRPGVENAAYLRRLLRDQLPEVQIEAARALMARPR